VAPPVSTTSINVQRRTLVVQFTIDTSCRSLLVCGLVLWVTGRFAYFATVSCREC